MKIWRRCSGSPIPSYRRWHVDRLRSRVVDLAANKKASHNLGGFREGGEPRQLTRGDGSDTRRGGRPTVNRWRSSPPVGQLASVDLPLDGGDPVPNVPFDGSRRRHLGRPWRYVDLHFQVYPDCAA